MPDHFDLPSAKQKLPRAKVAQIAAADRDVLEARAALLRAERAAAERRIKAADTGLPADYPAYDAACEDFELADDELALVDRRLDELEEDEGWQAIRERRAAYWAGAL